MNDTAMKKLLEDLTGMAANLLTLATDELQIRKSELDAYVDLIKKKMSGPTQDIAGREFEKCRVCAREWIKVYNDPTFDNAIKKDILREDAAEFFFTVDERIIAVQKNFFLLGMVDEIMSPSEPFSSEQRDAKIANAQIRMLAREHNLKPTTKNVPTTPKGSATTERLWFFGDARNFLQSTEAGLSDREALDYLRHKANE